MIYKTSIDHYTAKALMTVTIGAGLLVVVAAVIGLRNEFSAVNMSTPSYTQRFAVLELFTSEGCSSCPPADEFVRQLQREDSTGKLYILAFHVDYWDHQGWKDRFSKHEYSTRQRQYASWFSLQNIYTPQLVINGTREYVGSDKRAVLEGLSSELTRNSKQSLEIKASVNENQITLEYRVAGENTKSEIVIALVQKTAESEVSAGENSGHRLTHVQIVRSIIREHLEVDINKTVTFKKPDDFNERSWEIIVFVQRKSNGHITAATRHSF